MKRWSPCAGTTRGATALRWMLLPSLSSSTVWEPRRWALAKQRGESTAPCFRLFVCCEALSALEDGGVHRGCWLQAGRRTWGPIWPPAEGSVQLGCGHSESLLREQLPSPEPGGSKEGVLSRDLCPWPGVSAYIHIYIK